MAVRPTAHASGHYASTAGDLPEYPPFSGKQKCEICVVGGGFAGLVTAIELAKARRDVVLLDAGLIAGEASGRSAGFVSPGFARSIFEIEEISGREAARELFRLSVEGVAWVRHAIRDAPDDGGIVGRGYLTVIRHGDALALERRAERMSRDYGHPLEFTPRSRLAELLDTQTYFAGIQDDSAFHLHPLRYARLLASRAQAGRVRIHERSRVKRLRRQKTSWKLIVSGGVLEADEVVLATSAGRSPWPRVRRAIVPVATHMAAFAGDPELLRRTIGFGGCIADTRRAGDYFRLSGSKDAPVLLWGGRITTRLSSPARLGEIMRRDMESVFPQLSGLELQSAWSGTMGYTPQKMPLIGPLEKGLWVATGFGGHGLNTTAMGGSLVASAIVSGDDRYHLFDAWPASNVWGPVGRMAAQIEYWRLGLLDRLEEARFRFRS